MKFPVRRRAGRSILLVVSLGLAILPGFAAPPAAAAGMLTAAGDPMLTRIFPSIVRIEAIRLRPRDGRLTKQWTGGSGVTISAEGHVVTNCHVTEDGDFFRCYLYDGSHVEAKLVGQDPLTDLAVLQMDVTQRPAGAAPLVVAEFGDSSRLEAGEEVFALGSPGFLAQSVTRGIVSNPSLVLPEQTIGRMMLRGENVGMLVRWVLHDARIFGGNSGGPLVNRRGEIVGINEIGVVGLSGAIPSNVARVVARSLIETGRVIRGWSGITVQPRLEAAGEGAGVLVSDVAAGSPAAGAGVQPGDLIIACDGQPIEGGEEKAVSHFNRLEASQLPGTEFTVEFMRGDRKKTARIELSTREPARLDDVELRTWGLVVRDLTQKVARDERLPDARGVWLENVRPAGPAGQAEPNLRPADVLISIGSEPVATVAEMRALTARLLAETPGNVRAVMAGIRRDGAVLSSVVELRKVDEHAITPQARKAWLGASSQPLTPKLSAQLNLDAPGGVRLTRIYPGTQAEKAGLQIGDIILAIDGMPVPARRAEDTDVLARQIRQYRIDTVADFTIWREGRTTDVKVTLEQQPVPAAEMPRWDDDELEYTAREISFDDRVRLQIPTDAKGVLIQSAIAAGWASLAGLRADDLVEFAGGTRVTTIDDLRQARERAVADGEGWWVLLVRRRGQTLFVEINLKPINSKP
jgi:serine protease Do